jgi:imidazolonepropionase-like amidohydrolase
LRRDQYADPSQAQKQQLVWSGTERAFELAGKYKAKVAWGTDILLSPEGTADQGRNLAVMARWFTPARALRMATGDNGALMALSGPRNPYDGKLGVIEKDAFADLLVVDGDPTNDLSLLADPDAKLKLIMKDGRLHKSALAG